MGGGDAADPASLFTRGDPEGNEEVGFAGAGIAEQHDRVTGVEVGARREGGNGGGVDGRRGVEVEVGESFGAREAGFVDAALSTSLIYPRLSIPQATAAFRARRCSLP